MATLVGIAGTSTAPSFDAELLAKKQDKLFAILRDLEQVLVAYSGGTDSAYLAWAAARVLGDKAVAITADSASIPESHKRDAEEFARAEKTVFEVEEAAIEMGGTITGEHGVGLYKKRLLEKMVGSPSIQMMRTLKNMMDPNNILNPGKIFDLKPKCEGRLPRDREQIKKFEDVAWV